MDNDPRLGWYVAVATGVVGPAVAWAVKSWMDARRQGREQARVDRQLDATTDAAAFDRERVVAKDALAEAWRNAADARAERQEALKQVSKCRDGLASCMADRAADKVEIRARDEEIKRLRAENADLRGEPDPPPAGR